jgi:hypothetical protein
LQHLHDIGAGRTPMPTSDAKRHHYIAQFILRQFVDPAQPRERLWQLDKMTGSVVPQTTESAASLRRLYRVIGFDGAPTDLLEGVFAMVESHAAESVRRLVAADEIDDGARANIALLLALQDGRTPAGQTRMLRQIEAAARGEMAVRLADRRFANRLYRQSHPGVSEDEAERSRLETLRDLEEGDLIVQAPKEHALKALIENWLQFAGELADLRWKALRSRNEQFIIGDRPMVMHDPTPRYPFSGNGIKSSPTAYTLMPLAPLLCLRLDQSGAPFETRHADRQVERINLRSYGWAERFIYAGDRTVLEKLHARVQSDPDLAPGPRPNPQIICEEADPDDPAVGAEHPPGYPRGLWYEREDGSPVYMSYRLQYADDPRTVSIDQSYYGPDA